MNQFAELGLSALFQCVMIFNAWTLFYLLFFAHFIQCLVQTFRRNVVIDGPGGMTYLTQYPIPWQYIPQPTVDEHAPPDPKTTEKNKKITLTWIIVAAVVNVVLIAMLLVGHFTKAIHTKEFLLKNVVLFFILMSLEGLFFFFVGWYDFPITQAKGAATYLREILGNITSNV